jgi:hypothetical protein
MRAAPNQRTRAGQFCLLFALVWAGWMAQPVFAQTVQRVVLRPGAHRMEQLAAREVRRYAYLRTGALAQIQSSQTPPTPGAVVVAIKGDAIISDGALQSAAAGLNPQEYVLRTVAGPGAADRVWWIIGGDAQGALYGAYRFAEKLGVRFYLHGDVVPESPLGVVPDVNETGRPKFAVRGGLPFHDFPEGPDWWNRDDYLAYTSQLAKQRQNFLGFHTYSHLDVEEPQVWIGLPEDHDASGQVRFSYPAAWANTGRRGFAGYEPMLTSEFTNGAARLFATDLGASELMAGLAPQPASVEDSNLLFNRAGELFREVFAAARGLGIQTCVGTDMPMILARWMPDHLQQLGKPVGTEAMKRELYQGVFGRIHAAYPVDYYWLWTPEAWVWTGNTPFESQQVSNEFRLALSAMADLGQPMQLITCGWVLGPQQDRRLFDKMLPAGAPITSLSRATGIQPIDMTYEEITSRPKWAIPWPEIDSYISAPQLWGGRMLYDAADAHWLGCEGLIGIHWRTRVSAPSQAALAVASWDLSYVPTNFHLARPALPDGAVGGTGTSFSAPVADTTEDVIYQSVRYDMSGYRLAISNGLYTVTLKFNEPYYTAAGRRKFGAKLQRLQVLQGLDIFAAVGGNRALDFTYPGITVTNGELRIDFTSEIEYPCIAAIVIAGNATNGASVLRKINCGGPAALGYESDPVGIAGRDQDRAISPQGLYTDFASASFGSNVASAVGAILAAKDGRLFLPVTWDYGAGSIIIQQTPWSVLRTNFTFVDDLAALRPQVQGAGNLARFDYWLNTYRYLSELTEVACARGQFDLAMQQVSNAATPQLKLARAQTALTNRIALARTWDRMMAGLISTVSSSGELGTVANLHQQNIKRRAFLTTNDAALATALGAPLPASVNLATDYQGPARLVVPTARTLAASNEALTVRALLFASNSVPQTPVLHWRWLGASNYQSAAMTNVGGANYRAALPPATNDLEYRVTSQLDGTNQLLWPPGGLPQSVVIWSPPVRPPPPTNLTATAGADGVTLRWDAPPLATGYVVKRAVSNALFFPKLAGATATTFTDTTATNAAPCFYVVSATNADFESVNSVVVPVIPSVALAVIPQAGGEVLLQWPGWANGVRPYRAGSLTPPAQWQPLTNPPLSSNGFFQLRLPASDSGPGFFRLGYP